MAYKDPVISKLIEALNAEGLGAMKNRWFYGDPLHVSKSMLPAGFISKDTTNVITNANGEIRSEMAIVINVVYDLSRDFNQAFENVTASNSVYDIMEGRNPDYTLKTTSVVYILDKHQTLDTNLWLGLADALAPNYGIGIQKRGADIYTVEGVIRLTATHHQLRPGP